MHGTVCAPASSPSVYKGVPTDTPVIEGGRGVLAKLGLGNHMDLLSPPVDLQMPIGHNFMHVYMGQSFPRLSTGLSGLTQR